MVVQAWKVVPEADGLLGVGREGVRGILGQLDSRCYVFDFRMSIADEEWHSLVVDLSTVMVMICTCLKARFGPSVADMSDRLRRFQASFQSFFSAVLSVCKTSGISLAKKKARHHFVSALPNMLNMLKFSTYAY